MVVRPDDRAAPGARRGGLPVGGPPGQRRASADPCSRASGSPPGCSALIAIEIALQSPIEAYDTTLFSDHMVQHVLLTMVAAPLLALGAPITLLLRFARPEVRKRWILPVLHSRIARGHLVPGRDLDPVRRLHVGRPLLQPVRAVAREPVGPPARARRLPGHRPPVLVAGGGSRPQPVADAPPAPAPVHVPADAPEHVPRRGPVQRDRAPLPLST